MDRTGPHPGKVGSRHCLRVIILAAAIALITSLSQTNLIQAATPSSCVLKWGTIDTPGGYPQRNDIRYRSEINALAVSRDGSVMYALDIPNSSSGLVTNAGIWRSGDGGISWSQRPTQWLARTPGLPAPVFPVAALAIAPDDTNLVAAVCMNTAGDRRREVYYSEDGGTVWNYSGAVPFLYGPDEQIGSIAITDSYDYRETRVHDIIVGSRNPAGVLAQGEVYALRCPGMAGWQAQGFTGGDILALQPSPSYDADATLVVIACTAQRTSINLGLRDTGANVCIWNTGQGYPVELCTSEQAGASSSGKDRVITSSLALPDDFDGGSGAKRIIFAACDSNGAAMGTSQPLDDVYRINDTIVTRLNLPAGRPRVSSIAYSGSAATGKLLAGCVESSSITGEAHIWFTANPLEQCSTWVKPLKPPTGGYNTGFGNAQVAWTGDGSAAFSGTGSGNRSSPAQWADINGAAWASSPLDESAFSLSRDDGVSWNQLSLIDTQINRFRALGVAGEGKTVYISSVNDNGLGGTWRSRTSVTGEAWQRIACLDFSAPLLRLAPDDESGSVVFLGNQGSTRIIQSRDSGQTWRECVPGVFLQDMAAGSSDELYVIQADALTRRGRYEKGGWVWDKRRDTGLLSAHNIVVQGGSVMAGAAMGRVCPVAYSLDHGDNWELITEPAYSNGNRHVAFDDDFQDNRLIYLADDAGGQYRWTVGNSNRWDDMVPPDNSYYGQAAAVRGMYYAAFSQTNDATGVSRTTYSRGGIPKDGIFWDSLSTGLSAGVRFRLEPTSLVYADDTLWAFDARDYDYTAGTGLLWAFRDTLANHSPWLISPKGNSLVYCDPVTGRNAQVDLRWEQLSLADAYQVEVGKDKWFDLVVTEAEPVANPFFVPENSLYPSYYIRPGVLPAAGQDYFWRVRVRRAATGQVIRSRWSPAFSFSVHPGYPVSSPSCAGIESLQPCHNACEVPPYPLGFSWSPTQGTTGYRFVLAGNPELDQPVIDQTVDAAAFKLTWRLEYARAYFWQVTPLKPVPGDSSPVFSFNTAAEPTVPTSGIPPDNITNGLLVALVFTILFGLSVQVIIYRNRRQL
ncbi:MAG: hypothetical protein WC566_03695 [Dehalococcoidia bacterium]